MIDHCNWLPRISHVNPPMHENKSFANSSSSSSQVGMMCADVTRVVGAIEGVDETLSTTLASSSHRKTRSGGFVPNVFANRPARKSSHPATIAVLLPRPFEMHRHRRGALSSPFRTAWNAGRIGCRGAVHDSQRHPRSSSMHRLLRLLSPGARPLIRLSVL